MLSSCASSYLSLGLYFATILTSPFVYLYPHTVQLPILSRTKSTHSGLGVVWLTSLQDVPSNLWSAIRFFDVPNFFRELVVSYFCAFSECLLMLLKSFFPHSFCYFFLDPSLILLEDRVNSGLLCNFWG